MSEYLFAYGTLQPGQAAAEIAATVARLRPIGSGYVHGLLYDLGEYPGAILSSTARSRIHGTVFRLSNDAKDLTQLDEYEGFDPVNPAASLFIRKAHPVKMSTGRTLRCWVYEYNQKPESARLVPEGLCGRKKRHPSRSARAGSARAVER